MEPNTKDVRKINVRKISANKPIHTNVRDYRKLRVCAYGRVSTDSDEQATSILAQKSYFMDKIFANPEWEFAGYYEDEGISGKSVEKRLGFQKMIQDCKDGKIDLILTKSVSRFSRNTVDSISYARSLKSINVEVKFDQDGFGTFDLDAEMRLTIMAMLAQEEIVKQSRSIKFGKEEKARQGKVSYNFTNWYGYEATQDKKPLIVPEEAVVIEKIYAHYIAGDSMNVIAQTLNTQELRTKQGKKWSRGTIQKILTDHRYCGNYLYGKTYKPDPLSSKTLVNTGQVAQYLIENVHDGIVSVETFNIVQHEIKKRNDVKVTVESGEKLSKYSSKYALTEKLYCAKCKSNVTRKTWIKRNGDKQHKWVCRSRAEKVNHKCDAPSIEEYRLHEAIVRALNQYNYHDHSVMEMVNESMQIAISSESMGINPVTLKNEIIVLEKAFSELLSLSTKSRQPEIFEEKFREIAKKIEEKKEQYDKLEQAHIEQGAEMQRLERALEYINAVPHELLEYDDNLVREVVKRIGIIDKDTIKITFIDDNEIEVVMVE